MSRLRLAGIYILGMAAGFAVAYCLLTEQPKVSPIPTTQHPKVLASKLQTFSTVAKYSDMLKLAHRVAVKNNIDPLIVQGIMLKESRAGKAWSLVGTRNAEFGNRSYGVMQIKVEAARSVFQRTPKLVSKYFPNRTYKSITDEEVIALLLTNHESNVQIACSHMKIYYGILQDWDATIAAYNMGIGNAMNKMSFEENEYLIGVKEQMDVAAAFNNNNKL